MPLAGTRQEEAVRRPLLALALLTGALAATAQTASTAGNTVPGGTAHHRSVTVVGASLMSVSYSSLNGKLTTVTPTLRGTGLLASLTTLKPVSARFGPSGATSVVCTPGSLSPLLGLGLLGTLREGTYACNVTALLESASRPRPLTITVG
jgi:hypothetical protein